MKYRLTRDVQRAPLYSLVFGEGVTNGVTSVALLHAGRCCASDGWL